ncbi:MAG TPA: hypothetical protein VGM82_02025 [Gemmatimonadaceae bacterium]|jgi:hypothetical protein
MSERRYSDEEVDAIFRLASDDRPVVDRQLPSQNGLTLSDLQSIGRDVGIAPDAVARAAVALDVQPKPLQRSFLGLPIGVGRTVELNRKMSDEEWERFVVQLRETFRARGTTRSDGSLRQWTNGNLHVLLEPTSTGHRLRFGTYNANARMSLTMGLGALAVATVSAIAAHAAQPMLFLGIAGVAMIANGAFRLPRWARLRGRQMDELAAEAAASQTSLPRTGGID